MYLGARFPSHSSFRYTEGRHGLYDLLQTIVSENMMMIFSYLIVPSFTYPSCLPCPLKHCLLPLSQFHNTHHLLSKSTRSVQESNDERGREGTGRCHQPPSTTVTLGPALANDCLSLLWVIVPRFQLFHPLMLSHFFCKGLKSCHSECVI